MIPFGPYRLHKRIAVGGMAEVFLGRHKDRPAEPLVIKRILPHLEAKPDFVNMFEDEARLSSRLLHPNLVRIHDAGTVDNVHFIAMEYVEGLALSRLLTHLPGRRLPHGLSCWIVAEACAGLGYAHELTSMDGTPLKIVHRDISPDNILLSRAGEVKLADFGIAKASLRLTQTRPGQRKGKLTYMSPEQLHSADLDHRSDIFSLGSVLYELTTGRRVFGGRDDVEVLSALSKGVYTAPQEAVVDYPTALAEVVQRALARRPEDRFQKSSKMRRALLAAVTQPSPSPATELAALVQQMSSPDRSDFDDSGPTTMPRGEPTLALRPTEPAMLGVDRPGRTEKAGPGPLASAVDQGTARLVALRAPNGHLLEPSSAPALPDVDRQPTPPDFTPAVATTPSERINQAGGLDLDEGLDSNPTARWNAAESPHDDNTYHADEHTQPLDPASLRAIEGAPWGWLVVVAVILATASLLVLLYLQN